MHAPPPTFHVTWKKNKIKWSDWIQNSKKKLPTREWFFDHSTKIRKKKKEENSYELWDLVSVCRLIWESSRWGNCFLFIKENRISSFLCKWIPITIHMHTLPKCTFEFIRTESFFPFVAYGASRPSHCVLVYLVYSFNSVNNFMQKVWYAKCKDK